ncbi:hypothetical protein Agub_g4155 [Astrephomene gubernaculifera]|uniref:Transmembrane protein n=1 Tax=Astrephomene gubernaculifera TaxID=47775 RepID=A0AAD3DKB6_9CHLO|nr:hypothetical protein Agub_g4155 [Astrephomene gubernaculifera]
MSCLAFPPHPRCPFPLSGVLLLPVFFNHVVQSTLQALLFGCYLAFVVALLVLFRPQEQSSYLMVGFSEEDAEVRGVNQLSTSIAMAELDEGARGGAGGSKERHLGGDGGEGRPLAPGSAEGGSAASERAAKKAGKDADRYRQLPSLPTSSNPSLGGAAGGSLESRGGAALSWLPAGTLAGGSGGVQATTPSCGLSSGTYRGRQSRTYSQQEAPREAGPFTLGDEEEDNDDASQPLARPAGLSLGGGSKGK